MGASPKIVPFGWPVAGWFLVNRSYLKTTYEDGIKAGIIQTDNVLSNGRQLAKDLKKQMEKCDRLQEELNRIGELIDQTQRDAYDLGHSHGLQGKPKPGGDNVKQSG